MIDKSKWISIVNKLKEIIEHYQLKTLSSHICSLNNEINDLTVKCLFVGHFNAGKTALLNKLINRNGLLIEDSVPQTAVATELIFSEDEKIEVYELDGNRKKLKITDTAPDKNVDHLAYYLNSSNLKRLDDFIIVDTPGFDSGIDNHNRALSSYLSYGSCFVLVINIEKGTIDESTLNFVEELSNYSSDFVVILNKAEKLTDSNRNEIKENVEDVLIENGISAEVFLTSKFDTDISDKLVGILNTFDGQYIFDKQAIKMVENQIFEIEGILNSLYEQNNNINTFDFDKELNQLQQSSAQIRNVFERKKEELNENLPNKIIEIKAKIKNALIDSASEVTYALQSGGTQAVEAIIIEKIRPIVLSSFRDYASINIEEIIFDMNSRLSESQDSEKTMLDIIVNNATHMKELIDMGVFEKLASSSINKQKKTDTAYHVISGMLAIATDIIAPWLEIIIILAPDIVSFLKTLFGESQEEAIKKSYINNTVPQILNRLHDSLVESLTQSNDSLITFLEQQLNESVNAIEESINNTKNRKQTAIDTADSFLTNIEKDREILKRIKEDLYNYEY